MTARSSSCRVLGTARSPIAIDAGKARAAALRIRPIEETIRDSTAWEDVRPQIFAPQSRYAGQARGPLLTRKRERELLELWRARVGANCLVRH